MSLCACAGCLREFTGLTAFDRHQTAGDGSFGSVTCHDPAERGLVLNERGRWGFPPDDANRVRLASLRAERGQPGISGTPQDPDAAEAATEPRTDEPAHA